MYTYLYYTFRCHWQNASELVGSKINQKYLLVANAVAYLILYLLFKFIFFFSLTRSRAYIKKFIKTNQLTYNNMNGEPQHDHKNHAEEMI